MNHSKSIVDGINTVAQQQKIVEEQIQKCLKVMQSALGIENQYYDLEPSVVEDSSTHDTLATDGGKISSQRKNNDFEAMRTIVKRRQAEAKALFAENQVRFIESRTKFERYASAPSKIQEVD